jgi:hypothetical protein
MEFCTDAVIMQSVDGAEPVYPFLLHQQVNPPLCSTVYICAGLYRLQWYSQVISCTEFLYCIGLNSVQCCTMLYIPGYIQDSIQSIGLYRPIDIYTEIYSLVHSPSYSLFYTLALLTINMNSILTTLISLDNIG